MIKPDRFFNASLVFINEDTMVLSGESLDYNRKKALRFSLGTKEQNLKRIRDEIICSKVEGVLNVDFIGFFSTYDPQELFFEEDYEALRTNCKLNNHPLSRFRWKMQNTKNTLVTCFDLVDGDLGCFSREERELLRPQLRVLLEKVCIEDFYAQNQCYLLHEDIQARNILFQRKVGGGYKLWLSDFGKVRYVRNQHLVMACIDKGLERIINSKSFGCSVECLGKRKRRRV